MKLSTVKFCNKPPRLSALKSYCSSFKAVKKVVLFFDRQLEFIEGFKEWASQFPDQLALEAGENLKTWARAEEVLSDVLNRVSGYSRQQILFVAAGGGSVGDFVGFLASVTKRGVQLIHLPTTWLSAVDSAHGGKTALNFGDSKNQVGTFYPAGAVVLVRPWLQAQGEELARSALGEVIKMGLLSGGTLYREMLKPDVDLWACLPPAIAGKYKIVRKDPYEFKGDRLKLNLGHTLGHVLELKHQLPHGVAVGLGLKFVLDWGLKRKIIKKTHFEPIQQRLDLVFANEILKAKSAPITEQECRALVGADKKAEDSGSVQVVFYRAPGKVSVDKVSVDQLISEAQRQGWVR